MGDTFGFNQTPTPTIIHWFVHKLRGEYRWQIIVKGKQPHELLKDFVLPLGWRVDVDPMSVL